LLDRGAPLRGADERAGRSPPLAGPGRGRDARQRPHVRRHGRPDGGGGTSGAGPHADHRHPLPPRRPHRRPRPPSARAGRAGGRAPRREAARWLEIASLADRADALPSEQNLHQRKFLELARALAPGPRLILLDEVLSGLTPSETAAAIRLVREIRERGATVVF